MNLVLGFIVKIVSTNFAKTLIALAVNKLLESKGDGITSDIAQTMIDGIALSKSNPTTANLFEDVKSILKVS